MRRTLLLILVLATAFIGNAAAQSYPEELAGDQFIGVMEDLAFVPTENFNLPWSMPEPTGDLYWVMNIIGPQMPPLPLLEVEVKCLAGPDGCLLPGPGVEQFVWNPDVGTYANVTVVAGGQASIECYTWQYYHWRHYTGLLEYTGSPPQWWDWGWYTLDVAETVSEHQQYELATE
jgi:hypothetical protein